MSLRPAQLARGNALFLDVDGTLLQIADRPENVHVDARLRILLTGLHTALGGAVALVSGRPLDELDRLFHPLALPMAGQHGYERRDATGVLHRLAAPVDELDAAAAYLEALCARHTGLLMERKDAGLALHFRMAPACADLARRSMEELADRLGAQFELLAGKMVFEIKPAHADKGRAVAAFMEEAPFRGRVPVFIGDDITDEFGFAAVQRAAGSAIKVGAGTSIASLRLAGPHEVHGWLQSSLTALQAERDNAG